MALGVLGATTFAVSSTPSRAATSPPHIMVIVEENAGYTSAQGMPFIIGNSNAPYINSLARTYTSATHWFSNQHNSPNDYLDLISGSNQGLSEGVRPPYASTTLVDELNANNIRWKAYMESMPSNCATGSTTLYSSDHNPFSYFNDYHSLCSGGNGVVPYTKTQLSSDLNSSNPPDFVWITPNVCDDMHTAGGPCGSEVVSNGDDWLSGNLPTVLSSSWYANGGIIILTWDESTNGDKTGGTFGVGGHIPTIVISGNSHSAFGASGDHFATLRGIEEAYDVPLLGSSSDPSFGDITPAFGVSISAPPPTVTSVSPSDGAAGTSALVTINGSNFNGPGFTTSNVRFGGSDILAGNTYPCPGAREGCFAVTGPTQISAYTPTELTAGTVDVVVVTPGGTSPTRSADEYTSVAPGAYTAVTPFRVCDTRAHALPANQCTGSALGPGGELTLQVTGVHGPAGQVVPANALAAVINLTGIDDSGAATYLTAFPAGGAPPMASNINLKGRATHANLAIVQLSASGKITLFNAAGVTDAIVDVEGYFAPPSGPPVAGTFHSIPPLRICDTRANTKTECAGATSVPLQANSWRDVVVSGLPPGAVGGQSIPSDGTAAAAAFNLTATQGTAATYLAVAPPNSSDQCPSGAPSASTLNPAAATTVPNRVVASLGPRQDVCVYNAVGRTEFIIDVDGWFGNGTEAATGALFYSVPPTRICDTRTGSGTECAGEPLTNNASRIVHVAGVAVVPTTGGSPLPVAIVANLTGVSGSAATYLTIYPSDAAPRPVASDLNPVAGTTVANLAIVALATTGGTTGDVALYNAVGNINAILDVAGWFQ